MLYESELYAQLILRSLNQKRVADKVSTKSMLDKFKLLSVNQLAAGIKLLEVRKHGRMPHQIRALQSTI